MRLTLRTLLAYLDDTLEPDDAKLLGTKLAESEPAQDMVERIKEVLRRRRLTVPPANTRLDPNMIAEYLDNEITPESAEELERVCLASDVHLAEVAACHQILTVVLGEPAEVPVDVVRRMYELGKGKPVNPPRRPRPPSMPDRPVSRDADSDETLRMGLPPLGEKDGLARWLVAVVGSLACLLLGVAIWQLMKPVVGPVDPLPDPNRVAEAKIKEPTPSPEPAKKIKVEATPSTEPGKKVKVEAKKEPVVEPVAGPELIDALPTKQADKAVEPAIKGKIAEIDNEELLPPPRFVGIIDPKTHARIDALAYDRPNRRSMPIGVLGDAGGPGSVLIQYLAPTKEFRRIDAVQNEIFSARILTSLPGSRSVIQLNKGVRLTLLGNLPEHVGTPPLQESSVELFANDEIDLDLFLRRGRIQLTSTRDDGPAIARVRFENSSDPLGGESSWLIVLPEKGGEVIIERYAHLRGEPFYSDKSDARRRGPIAQMECRALTGVVHVKAPGDLARLDPMPGDSSLLWTSRPNKFEVRRVAAVPAWLNPKTVVPPTVAKAKQNLAAAFAGKGIDIALTQMNLAVDSLSRKTAIRCLGAIDDLPSLLDTLGSDKADQRLAAVETLALWIASTRDNDYKFADAVGQRLGANETEAAMSLLHGIGDPAASRPDIYETLIGFLGHPQLPIRELAAWNLVRLVPLGAAIPFDAADPVKREVGIRQWKALIPKGKMPPQPKTKTARVDPDRPADRDATISIRSSGTIPGFGSFEPAPKSGRTDGGGG